MKLTKLIRKSKLQTFPQSDKAILKEQLQREINNM